MVGDRTFVSNLTAHHGEFKFELFFSHNRQKHAQSSRYHVHLNELRIKNPFPFHLSCYLRKQRARNLNKTHLFLFILATVGRHIVCVQSTRNSREKCKRFPDATDTPDSHMLGLQHVGCLNETTWGKSFPSAKKL